MRHELRVVLLKFLVVRLGETLVSCSNKFVSLAVPVLVLCGGKGNEELYESIMYNWTVAREARGAKHVLGRH